LSSEESKTADPKPRSCPICGFATEPLSISEWRVLWETHKLSEDHTKKLEDQPNVTVAAIKCLGLGCWEFIVVPWHPASLKRFDPKTRTYHLVCPDPLCQHSNTFKASSIGVLSIPLTVLWKVYPKECESRFGPVEFRSPLNRSRALQPSSKRKS